MQDKERMMMMEEDRLAHSIRDRKKLLKQVFGAQKAKTLDNEEKKTLKQNKDDSDKRIEELAKPKDKWKRGKKLLELQKKFPHDMVLQKMIKEEFKENRVFKYPEEYDIYDDDEDTACKQYIGQKGLIRKDLSAGKALRTQFKQNDDRELYYEKQTLRQKRMREREMDQYMADSVQNYLSKKKQRLLSD